MLQVPVPSVQIIRAVLREYHAATHKAQVEPVLGPASLVGEIPVLMSCRPDLLTTGREVAVLTWSDVGGLVLGPYGAVPGDPPSADDADKVDGIHASATPTANKLLALNGDAKLPASITGDADTVDSIHAAATPTANKLLAMDANAKFPAHTVSGTLTVEGGLNVGTTGAGTGQIKASGSLAIGPSPAQSGYLRIPNNQAIVARNAADDGDVELIKLNASDVVEFGTGFDLNNQAITGVYSIEQHTASNWKLSHDGTGVFGGTVTIAQGLNVGTTGAGTGDGYFAGQLVMQGWLHLNNSDFIDPGSSDHRPAVVWGATDDEEAWFLGPTADTTKAATVLGLYHWGTGWVMNWEPVANNVYPGGNKTQDLGLSGTAWDDCWADDFQNEPDYYYMDSRRNRIGEIVPVDDLAVIRGIRPSGKWDIRTGLPLIDDASLPDWIFTKDKKTGETAYDPNGKPWLSLKMTTSLSWGAIRQLGGYRLDADADREAIRAEIAGLQRRLDSIKRTG